LVYSYLALLNTGMLLLHRACSVVVFSDY